MAPTATVARVTREGAIALVTGATWFALCAVLLGAVLPHSWASVTAVLLASIVVVLATARYRGISDAVTVGVASVVALDWHYIPPTHALRVPDPGNAVALAAYLVTGVLLGELAVAARRRAVASESARSLLADEQAALRRVATLVARETSPPEVFATVTREVGSLLAIDITTLLRYETDGTATVVASWSRTGRHPAVGTRPPVEGDNVVADILRTGNPARGDDWSHARGPLADLLRQLGVRSHVGVPVMVEGRLWGVMVGASASPLPIPAGTEARLGQFTELAGIAVANAQSRAELAASRARVVASADQARRTIERDLHDGVQQRLVTLGLGLRAAQDLADAGSDEVGPRLAGLREGLIASLDELRELSHGIHPAILAEGGLRPALANLARRSPVPATLDVRRLDRLPEQTEVGVYYVVSEALANVAKHAEATRVDLVVDVDDAAVYLDVRDDGVGGADPAQGSGLLGLFDRVHALGGAIEVRSPTGSGTSVTVRVPHEGRRLDPLQA